MALPRSHIMMAALTAGVFDGMITYPVETLKIRMQIASRRRKQVADPAKKATDKENKALEAPITAVGMAKQMWHEGGLGAFYPGLGYHLMGELTKSVWRFSLFEGVKSAYLNYFHRPGNQATVMDNMAISTLSATGETFLVVQPWDRLKIMAMGGSASPMQVCKKVFREEGFSGLVKNVYKGLDMTWARQISNNVWSFTMFYWLKEMTLRMSGAKILTPSQKFIYGGVAGAAGAAFSMPVDVIKSVKQSSAGTKGASSSAIARDIFQREGIGAFYRGTGARTALLFLKRAVSFFCYETVLEALAPFRK